MPRGGSRVGAGRKPKGARILDLHGGRVRGKAAQAVVNAPLETVDMPTDLPDEQKFVWTELAPLALSQRTLTKATASALRDLCEAIVMKRAMLSRIQDDGLTYVKVTVDGAGSEHSELKAHPLIAQHRGMMQRVEAGLARFRLAPIGKEIAPAVKAVDPFEEFDEGTGR